MTSKHYVLYLVLFGLPGGLIKAGWTLTQTMRQDGPINDIAFGRGVVPQNYLLVGAGNFPRNGNPGLGLIGLWDVETGSLLQKYTKSFAGAPINALRSVDWDPFEAEPYKFVASSSIASQAVGNPPIAYAFIFDSTGATVADLELNGVSQTACTTAMYHPDMPYLIAIEGSLNNSQQISLWDAGTTGVSSVPLSKMTHADSLGNPSNPVYTGRFIADGALNDHIVVTSFNDNDMAPPSSVATIWDISNPMAPVAAAGSPIDLIAGVNAFSEPATVLFMQTAGSVDLLINSNETSSFPFLNAHSALMTGSAVDNTFTSKVGLLPPQRNFNACPVATCVLSKPSMCSTYGSQMGMIYVGLINGDIGYQSSCEIVSADKPFNFVSGAHPGRTVGWASAYGMGDKGYLVTVAASLMGTLGEVKIWLLDSNGVPSLDTTITLPGNFARIAKFQPETNTLAIGYNDGTIQIWKLQ